MTSRADIDVLLLGGPYDGLAQAIPKSIDDAGEPQVPTRIGVTEAFDTVAAIISAITGDEMPEGSYRTVGHYAPYGISDNGRWAYIWHDHDA